MGSLYYDPTTNCPIDGRITMRMYLMMDVCPMIKCPLSIAVLIKCDATSAYMVILQILALSLLCKYPCFVMSLMLLPY